MFILLLLEPPSRLFFAGGDSKVLMIVQVAPVDSHVNETLCSLNFAQRVRSVELGMAQRRLEGNDLATSKARLTQSEVSKSKSDFL